MQIDKPYAPIEKINLKIFTDNGVEVFIKREDLSNPFISGNKWRKLKYHLLKADKLGIKTLVTFGGAYSNHLLATANAGAKYGFKTIGFVRGEEVNNHMLALCKIFGMQLFFVERNQYKNNKLNYAKEVLKDFEYCFFINEGGEGELGEMGVAELIEDFTDTYNHVFCSVGTGSTMRGLIKGCVQQKIKIVVHGICVLKGAEKINSMYAEFDSNYWQMHHAYHFGGYAKVTNELTDFVKEFASQTGILLDYIYEAKMMFALTDLIKNRYFHADDKILALHNGGILGMMGHL